MLDAADLDRWPEFFTEQCFYEIIPRENYDRGLPLAIMRCESKGMLKDRVVAIRDTHDVRTTLHAPHNQCHPSDGREP